MHRMLQGVMLRGKRAKMKSRCTTPRPASADTYFVKMCDLAMCVQGAMIVRGSKKEGTANADGRK